jgi:hypothetical protein
MRARSIRRGVQMGALETNEPRMQGSIQGSWEGATVRSPCDEALRLALKR